MNITQSALRDSESAGASNGNGNGIHAASTAEAPATPAPAAVVHVKVPEHAMWFSIDAVHALERRGLPEFFEGKAHKNADVYREARNWMVRRFRAQPDVYLTPTECRRALTGDACAILRIHTFLEHWGLINYAIRAAAAAPALDAAARTDVKIDVDPVFDGCRKPSVPRSTPFSARGGDLELLTAHATCAACGRDCADARYVSSAQAELVLCPTCFAEGRFPTNMYSVDFSFQELGTGRADANRWSEEETLKLLEGIER